MIAKARLLCKRISGRSSRPHADLKGIGTDKGSLSLGMNPTLYTKACINEEIDPCNSG